MQEHTSSIYSCPVPCPCEGEEQQEEIMQEKGMVKLDENDPPVLV